MDPTTPTTPWIPPRWHRLIVPALLLISAALASTSLLRDSITFDETSKLTAGVSYFQTSDYRLNAEHPPLGKLWAALPLLFVEHTWPPANHPDWVAIRVFEFGRAWLFEYNDNGQQLVNYARAMMVLLMLATALVTYALARMLFGPDAGLIALALAALSPTLLAHGRIVGTDVPVALGCAATLLATARVLDRPTWPRLLLAGLALAATSVTKFSWPVILPAVAAMAIFAVLRPSRAPATSSVATRAGSVGGSLLGMALITWAGIWLSYGGQMTIMPTVSNDDPAATEFTSQRIDSYWANTIANPDGTLRDGPIPRTLLTTMRLGLLPEPYIYGAALATLSTQPRPTYLCGEYSDTGWWYYFPVAAAIKTPLPTLLLVGAGLTTLVWRRQCRAPLLLVGCATFLACYGALAMLKGFNIGQRHLLPMYPLLFALAGGVALGLRRPPARWLIIAAIMWLAGVTLWTWPQYLSFFNVLVGGPRNGHQYLLDSNTDWGQHLLRLADYARAHPDDNIKLAYFGSAIPTAYLDCTALPSHYPFAPAATLGAGTYIVSVNQLYGLYDREIRDSFWTPEVQTALAQLGTIASSAEDANEPPEITRRRAAARLEYAELRAKRLLSRLRQRTPDDRIGHGLCVYRLSEADAAALSAP